MAKQLTYKEYQARMRAIRLEEQFFTATEKAAKQANCHPEKICPGYVQRLHDHTKVLVDLYNDVKNSPDFMSRSN